MKPTEHFVNKRGSQLISTMFNNIFYGVAMCMVAQYFMNHSHRDTLKTKLVVCVLVISATLEVVFANAQMYDILVVSFGNMDIGGDIQFSVLGKYATTFFTAFVAQIFYASRIWSIGVNMGYMGRKMKFLAAPVILFSALQLGAGLAQVVVMHISRTFNELEIRYPLLIIVATQGGASVICDIIITASITFILQTSRSGIKSNRTDSLLESLIKYAIQRSAATSVCGVLTIFLYNYSKRSYYFHLPCLVNTDIHVMSVVSLLISRETLRETLQQPQELLSIVPATRDDGMRLRKTSSQREA